MAHTRLAKKESLRSAFVMRCVIDAYNALTEEADLSPRNGRINTVLSALVNAASDDYSAEEEREVLQDARLKTMREKLLTKLSEAECRMEEYWAQYFSGLASLDKKDLQSFWYWDNYEKLTEGELAFFPEQDLSEDESIAFVGSGPLPLSAIIMHYKTGKPVTCIDFDPVAIALSRRLIDKAGLSDKIKVIETDAVSHNYENHPVVIVASLVGEKGKAVERIRKTRPDCFMGLRSAERLHTILYDPVDTRGKELRPFTFAGKTPHDPETINTTLFYQSKRTPLRPQIRNTHNLN